MARDEKRDMGQSPFSFDGSPPPAKGAPGGSPSDPAVLGTLMAPGQEETGPEYALRKRRLGSGRDEVSVYNDQMRARFAIDRRVKVVVALAIVVVVLVPLTMVLPTHLFSATGFQSSLAEMTQSLSGRINALSQMFSGSLAGTIMQMYFWQTLAVALAGAGLALNGAVFQGALKNALASPSTLGVMSGATLGTVIYTLFVLVPDQENQEMFRQVAEIAAELEAMTPWDYFIYTQARVLCSLAGSAVVVVAVLAIAYVAGRGHVSKVGLLIAGQVFSAVIASIVEMVQFYVRDFGTDAQYTALRTIVGGSFENFSNPVHLAYLAVPTLVCIVIVLVLRNRLNLLSFSDDEAKTMGLSVNATRNAVVVVCTVLTAVIVSFCGSVGFVGFLVPHLARMMVGPDFRYYLPASLLLGAAYLLAAFGLCSMSGVFEGSIGTLTSIIGVVAFIVLAVKQRREGNVEWV